MSTPVAPLGFFDAANAESYDARNRRLAPIGDGLHFLIRLALDDLPDEARVLCVGAGTGAEILTLGLAYPRWRFVGVDPSAPMLDVCRRRLAEAGLLDRCELVAGYVHDLPPGGDFDAVASVLVAHFVPRAERAAFFQAMTSRLRVGGTLVNAEVSHDLEASTTDEMIRQWTKIQALAGGTPESLASVPRVLREVLHVLPPAETERLMRDAGIASPVTIFEALMIRGWMGRK